MYYEIWPVAILEQNLFLPSFFGSVYISFPFCVLHVIYDMIYLLTAVGLTLSGSSTVHSYTQIVNRTT